MTPVTSETARTDVLTLENGETLEIEYESKIDGDGLPPSYIITPRQGRMWYDAAVRKYMGISGEEFLRRWDAGEWHDLYDKPGYWYIGYLVHSRSLAEPEP